MGMKHKEDRLISQVKSRANLLLALRSLRFNKGSKTPGVDGKTIEDYLTAN